MSAWSISRQAHAAVHRCSVSTAFVSHLSFLTNGDRRALERALIPHQIGQSATPMQALFDEGFSVTGVERVHKMSIVQTLRTQPTLRDKLHLT
jgi:hypothetical protein